MASTEAIFSAQAKVVSELGLKKIPMVHNKNYRQHGRKAYVYALQRFGFKATMPGPYYHGNQMHQRGLAHHKVPVGGRIHMRKHLMKKVNADGNPDPEGSQEGQVTADDQQNDSEYIVTVPIGTPPQQLKLDFDTGSSDLWVFSTELAASQRGNHAVFDSSKSSTFKESSGETWTISYGDSSSASGDVGTDVIDLGGLKIQNQAIELAKKASDEFVQGTSDGLLGLAWPSINTAKPKAVATPVENMISQNLLPADAQLFTSAFYAVQDNEQSFYTFGFIDQDLVSASGKDIAWTDIDNSQGFWMFPSESITVNGQTTQRSSNKAIADTGTTLCLVADDVCKALYNSINGATYNSTQQGYVIPKSVAVDDLPDFQVAIGNNLFTIQKENLLYSTGNESDDFWYGGVQSNGDMGFDIFGDVVLKSLYVIWDQGNTRLGAVPKIQKTQAAPGTTNAGQ